MVNFVRAGLPIDCEKKRPISQRQIHGKIGSFHEIFGAIKLRQKTVGKKQLILWKFSSRQSAREFF